MIEAKEVMIGNIVRFDSGEFPISTIGETTFSYIENNQRKAILHKGARGIPLTEDWALKLGGKKLPHFTVTNAILFDIGRGRVITIGCIGTPNLMVWISYSEGDTTKDLICIHNWDYDGEIFVHQFQNLVYSLSKTDLTFTK